MKRLALALVMAWLAGTSGVAEAGDKLDDFITRFYTLVLGRTPEPAGLANWRAYLQAHPTSAGAAAFSHGFLESPEFLGQNHPTGTYVTILYRAFMGREPDPGGHANWVSHLEAGRFMRHGVADLFIESPEFQASWRAIFPGAGPKILSPFGSLTGPEGAPRSEGPHNGIDIAGAVGDQLLAVADGIIYEAKANHGDCGTYVGLVPKGSSATAEYCHLQAYTVGAGAQVKRGDVIGYLGTSGRAPGPGYEHVHFGLWIGGHVDPVPYMVGCFRTGTAYPTDPLALTWPVRC